MDLEHFGFRHLLHSRSLLQGSDFLLHFISFVLSFGILICWGYFDNLGKTLVVLIKLICTINLRKLGNLVKFMKLGNSLVKWYSWII